MSKRTGKARSPGKRSDAELRESEQRFQLMADAVPVMIWMAGTDRLCKWINKPWLDFVGRSMEQELGNGWAENVHSDDFDHCLRTYTTAFDARQPFSMEYRVRRHDGEYRWVLDNGIPLHGEGGEFAGYIGSCFDITKRKQAEQALLVSEERIRAILNTAADAIITIDHGGMIQSINPATERMFGYAAAEMIGQNVKMLMPSPYRDEHDHYLQRYLETGEAHIIGLGRELMGLRKDGSTFPVDLAVSEVDHLKLFTGIIRDLTGRKDLEREVLEIASLEQKRIGQDLHDDCGQELTALGIIVDSLMPSLEKSGVPDADVVRKIGQGVQRVLRRVRNLAEGLARAEVEAAELPAALAELTSRLSETSGIRSTFDHDGAAHVEDRIQATHLYHIAQEACTNALRHSQAKHIEVSLRATGDGLVLCVKDDGIGIRPDQKPGLGLRIMPNRASVIGARLTIEPVQPHGTLVTCTLPSKEFLRKGLA